MANTQTAPLLVPTVRIATVEKSDAAALWVVEPRKKPVRATISAPNGHYRVGDVVAISEHKGSIRVLARLAEAESPKAALYGIAADLGLTPLHSDQVEAECVAMTQNLGLDDPNLEDLSRLAFVTIDNEDSRDLDQAMHLRRGDGDSIVISYALADGAHYVPVGTSLFEEALQRGASYYFPGFSIPMLPRLLSEDIVSLNEDKDRRALVFEMTLSDKARAVTTRVFRARIKSAGKLSYVGVQAYYDAPEGSALAGQPYTETLDLLAEVGRLLIDAAKVKDVVRYRRREAEMDLVDGVLTVKLRPRLEVEMFNEQVSLLCNIEGARLFMERSANPDLQPIFRVHPAPLQNRLTELQKFTADLAGVHGLGAEWVWQRDSEGGGESLADYLERLPDEETTARIRWAIERQAMLINERSSFTDTKGPHYGIGAPAYARFSSPMREIVGIFTHKEAVELLEGKKLDLTRDLALRDRVIESGNRSKEIQRNIEKRAHKLVLDQLFHSDLTLPAAQRPRRIGTLMGLDASRLYVQLDNPPAEIKVYLDHLTTFSENGAPPAQIITDFAIVLDDARKLTVGDRLSVWVSGYDEGRGKWSFTLVPPPAST